MSSSNTNIDEQGDPARGINFTPWREMGRLPSILQNEDGECGLACLAMMSGYFGAKIDLTHTREKVGRPLSGMTLHDMMNGASRLGLASRAVRVGLDSLAELQLPCILHWDMNHYVVLKKVNSKKVVLHDPRCGIVHLNLDKFSEYFTGVAIECLPNESFEAANKIEVPTLRSVVGKTTGLWGALAQIFVMALALQTIGILSPAAMQWLIDSGLQSSDKSLLLTIIAGMCLMLIINIVIGTARSWMVMYLTINLGYKWSSRVLHHLLHLPLDFFERRHLGDIMSRISSVSAIQGTITSGVIEGVLDGILAICFLAMIWHFNGTLAATAVVSLLLLIILQSIVFGISKRMGNESIVANAKVSSILMESLRGIRAIKLFGRSEHRLNLWQNLSVESININIRQAWIGIIVGTISTIISSGQRILAIYIAAGMIFDGSFTVGMLFAYLSYQDQFTSRAASLVGLFFNLRMLRLHFERLSDVVLTEPEGITYIQSSESDIQASTAEFRDAGGRIGEGDEKFVEFDAVSFRYADFEPLVIENLSFSTRGSACTVFTGKSGVGKTTVAKLILGIYKPESGVIRINGLPLNYINLEELRNMISCVMQDDTLFAGTIHSNIAMFDRVVDKSWMEQCAKVACIHDDICSMPMGYYSMIGDMGAALSAGQKQRILLARALYRKPQILILDEATSNLDVETEQRMNSNLSQLNVHRIYIAHRPQTIMFGDAVINLSGSGVEQMGDG